MANEIQMGVPAHGEVNDSNGKSVKKIITKAKKKTKMESEKKWKVKYIEIRN